MSNAPSSRVDFVGYGSGVASLRTVQTAIADEWIAVLANPAERQRAALALEIPDHELEDTLPSPVTARPNQSGTGLVEAAILIGTYVGTDLVWPPLRDMAREEIKRRAKQLWGYLEPKVMERLRDRRALGARKEMSD